MSAPSRIEERPGWREAVGWLVDAVRSVSNAGEVSERRPVPAGVADEDLAEIAEFHGVPGFARLAAEAPSRALVQAVHSAQGRHLRTMTDLATVVTALDGAGVDVLVAKGPSLVATSYAGPHLRSYVDLDLLVRPPDLARSVAALTAAGCRVLDANWPVLQENRVQELRLEGPSGGAVDLHWSLSGGGRADEDTAPAAAVLIDRSDRVELDGVAFRVLSPADLVVHVAVHAASSGGHRLVWLTDVRGALAHALDAVSADHVMRTAAEWQATTHLGLMATRASRIVGARTPDAVAAAGSRGPWGALERAAERWSPPLLAGQGGSLSRLVARSCRATPAASMRAAGAKGFAWARLGAPVPPGQEVMHDPTNPLSALYPAGGEGGAERFYAWVAAGSP